MSDSLAASYDAIPYDHNWFYYTTPDHIAAVAALQGLKSPDIRTCRVLEIGCATGSNLIPMALTLPDARFVGIDISTRQIEGGRAAIAALGIANLDLEVASVTELPSDFGVFDYIICHGVYSWVPEEVSAAILRVGSTHLSPDGVLYISYNTYPGWHQRGMVREMMRYRVRGISGGDQQVQAAREMLEVMVKNVPESDRAFRLSVLDEYGMLSHSRDAYLFHEHLEEQNRPCYFHEFLERAGHHGLRFLSEARADNQPDALGAEALEAIDRWSSDPLDREQYLDFFVNRTFRRSLLVHASARTGEVDRLQAVSRLWVSASARPVTLSPASEPDAVEEFVSIGSTARASTNHPLARAVFWTLFEHAPESLSFEELWDKTRRRIGPEVAASFARSDLAEVLARAFPATLVTLHAAPSRAVRVPGPFPRASRLARFQAGMSAPLTNLRHRDVRLNPFDTALLLLMDGTRDRKGLSDAMRRKIESQQIEISSPDDTLSGMALDRLDAEMEKSLLRIGMSALLEG